MHNLKRLLLSRKTVLILLLLISGSIILSYIFPQEFPLTPPSISNGEETPRPVSALFVFLDHIFTSLWFTTLLFFFLLSLLFSLAQQIKSATKKTFGSRLAPTKQTAFIKPNHDLFFCIKSAGYLQVFENQNSYRFVKYPWGYWGNVFLHLGIILVAFSSLIISLTEQRGIIQLNEGELFAPGMEWQHEEHGYFSKTLQLPVEVISEEVVTTYWENDQIKQLTTNLSFIDKNRIGTKHSVTINTPFDFNGIRLYQGTDYGKAFFLEIKDGQDLNIGTILQIKDPFSREQPGFGNFKVDGINYQIKAKYFNDFNKVSMTSSNPQLFLRLVQNDNSYHETSLKRGESAALGPYIITLKNVTKWSQLFFIKLKSMTMLYVGFLIIPIGGMLNFFAPPREIFLTQTNEYYSISFQATQFNSLYENEFKTILNQIKKKSHE